VPSWLLALFILVVWCLWAVAVAAQRAVEDARRGIPEGRRGGVSIFPVIPVFPVVLWGIGWLIDRAVSPWGTWAVGVAHGVFAACLAVSLSRDWPCLRSLDDTAGRDR
jgi:hypothetical protein